MAKKKELKPKADYGFECPKCDIEFTVEAEFTKPPKKTRCPNCNKFTSDRCFKFSHRFIGKGFAQNDARVERFYEKGYDKEQAKEFYNNAIKFSKDRQKEGGQHYERMHLDLDWAINNGVAKPISKEKAKEKYERAKKLRKETGIDKITDKK